MRRHTMPLGNIDGVLLACLARPLKSALQEKGEGRAKCRLPIPKRGEAKLDNQGNSSILKRRRLRIAQLAPLYERVPPRLYGGTERMVSFITEELVRRGHEVTLFASGDSRTCARLVPCCDEALRLSGKPELAASLQLAMLAEVYEKGRERFDIIHSHIDYWTLPFSRITRLPTVSTMHGRMDIEDLHSIYRRFPEAALVSISNSQRLPLPDMNWVDTIYHGLPRDLLKFNAQPGKYLAFIGRIAPEKASRPGNRNRTSIRSTAQDRGQSGCRRSSVFRSRDQATHPAAARRIYWRDQRR